MVEWNGVESPMTIESLKTIGLWHGYNIKKLHTSAHNSANAMFCGTSIDGMFVVKINSDGTDSTAIKNELALLSLFDRNANIIFLADVHGLENFLVMPMFNRTLTSFLNYSNIHEVTYVQRMNIMRGIADAMLFVVNKQLVHGDIKPDNILISGDGNAVLADFGICKPVDENATTAELLSKMMLISNYTIEYGVGMQAVGMHMFISDSMQATKTLLAVLDISVGKVPQNDIFVCAAHGKPIDIVGATATQLRIYGDAMSDITLISETNHARINPMLQPQHASFIDNIIRTRLIGNGPFGSCFIKKRDVYRIIKSMVVFTRNNALRRAENSWRLLGNLFRSNM
jgi:serine/threonine protein kinase